MTALRLKVGVLHDFLNQLGQTQLRAVEQGLAGLEARQC